MWHTIDIKDVFIKLKTNRDTGLTNKEAQKRNELYGKNRIEEEKKEGIFKRFIKQFNDFMIIILIIVAFISIVIAYIEKSDDYLDSVIIISIVIFNAIMGLIQEYKAEKSIDALKQLASPIAKVKRSGKIINIKDEDVTIGDILILEAGSIVSADCRIIKSSNLKIEEASLTGENLPIIKVADAILKDDIPLGDCVNMAFATTSIISGIGEGIVTNIGMDTKVGNIAKLIMKNDSSNTPLQKKLGEVGKKIGLVAVLMCFAIFIIGIIKKIPAVQMFMTSIGLAVAAIPEGMPAVITIMLSIGVTKMAKKNAIIRKLPAVETLGGSNVICSDKTGTLTQNKMEVMELATFDKIIWKNGEKISKESEFIVKLGSMCNNSKIESGKIIGEPTENAILELKEQVRKQNGKVIEETERVNELPFESERKMMTTIHIIGDRYRIVTKGAPDMLIRKCSNYIIDKNIIKMNNDIKESIIKTNEEMANKALRVLGVAYKDIDFLPNKIESENIEKDLVFTGLIGMKDPPRNGVKEAVNTCLEAGIKTVMITGDHIITAKAIAKEIGIFKNGNLAITGEELDKIPQGNFEKEIMRYSVFARVSPEHKVRIVNAFKTNNKIVAMTGDGVNDSPALKCANIGIAMGKCGTDVAKNASDMILTDDNFVTIVEAVKEGRRIYANIKKAIHFLIATNVGEIAAIFIGLLLGLETPLIAVQLLWINLVTDSFPAIALGLETAEKDIMKKKPIDPKKGIFKDGMWEKIITEGLMLGLLTLLAFSLGNNLYGLEVGRTMAFVSLGLLELIHSFNVRSDESLFKIGILKNKYLLIAFIVGVILQVLVATIPQLSIMFDCVQLNKAQWLYVVGISLMPILIMEMQKICVANQVKYKNIVRTSNISLKND